jgi:hypothetical protein
MKKKKKIKELDMNFSIVYISSKNPQETITQILLPNNNNNILTKKNALIVIKIISRR